MNKALLTLSLLIAACAADTSGTNFAGLETVEKDAGGYTQVRSRFNVYTEGAFDVPVSYRLFERNGHTAICGFFVNTGTGCDGRYVEEWFKFASAAIDGRPIGNASMMRESTPTPTGRNLARCVETAVPWDAKYAQAGPWLTVQGHDQYLFCSVDFKSWVGSRGIR